MPSLRMWSRAVETIGGAQPRVWCGAVLLCVASLAQAMAQGKAPKADEWMALLSAGYTTDEQRQAASGGAAGSAGSSTETTFF